MRRGVAGLAAGAAALLVQACALVPPACGADEVRRPVDTLFFGSEQAGGVVSADAWAEFLRDEVTPRFPDGLTAWDASGQWRGADARIRRERSFVLTLVRDDTPAADAAVRAVAAAYKARFQQEAVLRVRTTACIAF